MQPGSATFALSVYNVLNIYIYIHMFSLRINVFVYVIYIYILSISFPPSVYVYQQACIYKLPSYVHFPFL